MALEGSLDTFGLTDVLSLLAMTGKTGDLRLQRDDAGTSVAGYVRLRDGIVVAASSDNVRQALARQLIVSGLISGEVFDEVAESGAAGDALAAALATAASLGPDAVTPLARGQVLNAVFELLRWSNGAFTFDVVDAPASPVDASLTVDEAVAEAQRRLAAWPALTARVPAPQSVLAVTVTIADEAALTSDEWGVLGLFDGRRSIGEAITLSTSGEWETVSLLAGLVERGLLVPADSPSSAAHRAGLLGRLGLVAAPTEGPAAPAASASTADAGEPATSIPLQAAAPDDLVASAEEAGTTEEFASLSSLESAASALEAAAHEAQPDIAIAPVEAVVPDAGVDEALLQRLIAGVRAL